MEIPDSALATLSSSPAPAPTEHPWWWHLGWILGPVRDARIANMQKDREQQQQIDMIRTVLQLKQQYEGGGGGGTPMSFTPGTTTAAPHAPAPTPTMAPNPVPNAPARPMLASAPSTPMPVASAPAGATKIPLDANAIAKIRKGFDEMVAKGQMKPEERDTWIANAANESPSATGLSADTLPVASTPTAAPSPSAAAPHRQFLSPGESLSFPIGKGGHYTMTGQSADASTAQRAQEWTNTFADRWGANEANGMSRADAMRDAQLYATRTLRFVPPPGTIKGLTDMSADPTAPKPGAGPKTPFQEFQKEHAGETDIYQKWVEAETKADAGKAKAREEATTTANVRTMKAAAPTVLGFVNKIERNLRDIETGPAASRYQEFMTGRIGAPNPKFTTYRTNVGLLTTRLMQMHVGARGGEYIMKHFQGLFDAGVQSPENMRAALEAVREYATSLTDGKTPDLGTEAPPAAAPAPIAPTGDPELDRLFEKYGH